MTKSWSAIQPAVFDRTSLCRTLLSQEINFFPFRAYFSYILPPSPIVSSVLRTPLLIISQYGTNTVPVEHGRGSVQSGESVAAQSEVHLQ